ncbi:MAG: abortive infection family protein [Candidatus Delongbacteria bacterium]
MASELIRAETRNLLREYFVGTSLSIIRDRFEAAGITCDEFFDPGVSGERRGLVMRYYHALDLTSWKDVKKLMRVFESVLDELEVGVEAKDQYRAGFAKEELGKFSRALRRDGFRWEDARLLAPTDLLTMENIHHAISGLDAPELNRQITRLRDSVNDDPALAVGTAKEMLETTCKTILGDCGVEVETGWDVSELLKRTRRELKLLPDDVRSAAKGAETVKRLLSNLGQVGIGLAELRNLYGSGHGRAGNTKGLSPRHARLAVGAVVTVVQFLFETHEDRKRSQIV